MSVNNRPNGAIASSPGPSPQAAASDQASEQVSVRPMRLKVLYTFDTENKTNHLARWPQPLDIQSAFLDEATQIGVIELKTCIQAIAAASPEVVAKLSHDFTVYAYDYSEYETPLVGQGMLSWILASSSATPAAPAHQSRTMVTGRVCKNVMGLFGGGSQETLEVKLRLVPVPTSLQSEYIESMKKYREVSQLMPPGLDPQAWTSFLQANPGFIQQTMQSRSASPAMGAGYGIEQVQRLMGGHGQQQASVDARRPLSRANSYANIESAQQLPRMPSPALSVQSTASAPKRRGRPPGAKKPGPKGPRNRAASQKQEPVPQSNDTGYGSNDEGFGEDGPAKKRAKVIQAEWSGKQDFAKQPESLRVAASSAASVRIHQPTAVRPGANPAHALEGPPREPTPVGNPMQRSKPPLPTARSSLRKSMVSEKPEKKVYATPFPSMDASKPPESAVTSPENSRLGSSPPDIGSSPPMFGGSTAPCSPNLPELPPPNFADSGFMSGSIDDLFEDDELRPVDDDDFDVLAQHSRRPELPMLPLQQHSEHRLSEAGRDTPTEMTAEEKVMEKSRKAARHAAGLGRTASSGNLPTPQLPASDPVRPAGLSRCQTWSGHQAPHPASDVAPLPGIMHSIERPASRNRRQSEIGTGSGVRRKAAIQSKLATSIAAGEMPPFCENCGQIETPTWRKAWVKIHSGTPEHVRLSEDEGGIIAWQTLQTDHTGTVCLYRIIKKSILKTDEGFTEILLCNPCGIFLHTRKCMRPKSAWDKLQKGPDDKESKGPSGKRPRGCSMSNGSRNERSRSTAVYSDRSSPAGGQTEHLEAEVQLPAMKRARASSVERTSAEAVNLPMDDASAAAALQHAIHASPHKFKGTQDVPIELGDLTPQPTRRILFPSPTKSQEARSKRNSISGSLGTPYDASIEDAPQADKENRPPPGAEDDFSEFLHVRATTPTTTSPSKAHLFKTPLRTPKRIGPPPTTGDFFSSAAKALLRPNATLTPKRTPTRHTGAAQPLAELSPFAAHLNELLSDPSYNNDNGNANSLGNDENGSPVSNHTFDFPSLPSLHNTPGRTGTGSRIMDFDFSAFDSQDLISTDVPMPSSPPAWFGVYEDPDVELDGGLWGDDAMPNVMGSSPMKASPAPPTRGKSLFDESRPKHASDKIFFGDSPIKTSAKSLLSPLKKSGTAGGREGELRPTSPSALVEVARTRSNMDLGAVA